METKRYGVIDLGWSDDRSLASRLLTLPLFLVIRIYQLLLAPLLPPVCRFEPSCSRYSIDALRLHGPLRGGWLALRRIARCNPWGGSGFDPVPPRGPGIGIRDSGSGGS